MASVTNNPSPVPNPGGQMLSSRFANPLDSIKQAKPAGNYMVAGIFAIITTLCFVALLVIEWLDWDVIGHA